METPSTKILRNNQTDFSFIEQFKRRNDDGDFSPISIPADDVDFEIEFFANNGVRFKASRINGVYNYCEKVDDIRLRVYVPLFKCFLGNGWLYQKLWIKTPGNFWGGDIENICLPSYPGFWLWNGPSDDYKVSSEIDAVISGYFRGEDGFSPTIDVVESDGKVYLEITDANGTRQTSNLKGSGVGPEVLQQFGDRADAALSQKFVSEEFGRVNAVLFEQYTAVTLSRTPSAIEKGVPTQITLSWTTKFNGADLTPEKLSVKRGSAVLTEDVSLKTIKDTISDTQAYSIAAVLKGITKTATTSVGAYYPMYFGGDSEANGADLDFSGLAKQPIRATPAGQVTIALTAGQYLWLCVPEDMTIHGVGILNSFPVIMEEPVTVAVADKGNYKCYRSNLAMSEATDDTYIII